MASKTVFNALPKLPGYNISLARPITNAKSHSLSFTQGVPVVKAIAPLPAVTPSTNAQRFSHAAILERFPEIADIDNCVVRFFGYFTEPVTESSVETMRVRRVTVQFYVVDGTLNVVEHPMHATVSGLRGGCIMSRDVFDHVTLDSLSIGAILELRGLILTLVDCDAFTRRFYSAFGTSLGEPQEYPPDRFERVVSKQLAREKIPDEDYHSLKIASEMAAAAANGHPISIMTASERLKAQTFLSHDEILKFHAVHNHRDFDVVYFLCDNSIAVTELHAPNDGRDQLASFVRRGPVPKGAFVPKSVDTIARPRGVVASTITPLDLVSGQSITIYGRDFFLYDVDAFTRNYYQEAFGVTQGTFPKPPSDMDGRPKPKRPTDLPPYTGFGSEEDSLASWKRMVGKPPKKDTAKFIRHAGDVLRFAAELANPRPEDAGRQFIVCYFLEDETISVFEYAVRNTGHTGGKSFARAPVKSVTAESMYVGAELKLGGLVYRLVNMDERTEKFLDTGVSMAAVRDTKADELLARLRHCLIQRFSRVTEAYRHFNVSKTGIGIADLKRMFAECEVKVESEALLAECMRLVDADEDGVISLQEFVEHLLKQNLIAPQTPSGVPSTNTMTAQAFAKTQQDKAMRDFADAALSKFVAKLDARRAFIVDTFRIVSDRSVDGLIDVPTFRRAITDRLGLQMSEAEMDALVYRFFYAENMPEYLDRRLSLRDFRRVLDRCV